MINKLRERLIERIEESEFAEMPFVLGEGSDKPVFMMVGEAPGAEEERSGHPFVGKAGKNLSAFLEMLELERSQIYLTNVVKIRPSKLNEKTGNIINRPPSTKEINFFRPLLQDEINTIQPNLIIPLGNFALQSVLLDRKAHIGHYHGRPYIIEDRILNKETVVFPLYHPAAIIYNGSLKEAYEEDLLKLKEYLKQASYLKE